MSSSITKKKVYKAILENPYGRLQWPEIEEKDEKHILESLKILAKSGIEDGHIITGFNEINEAVEQSVQSENKPTAMIICRSDVNSSLVTGHFPLLSAVSDVKLIALPLGSAQQIATAAQISPRDASFILVKPELLGAQALYESIENVKPTKIPWIKEHKTAIRSVKTHSGVSKTQKNQQTKTRKAIKEK